jgi:hypothetical protein
MSLNNLTYKLRIVADTEDDIFIDISINSNNTFLQLHDTIVNGFKLDGGEMASFYKSNDNWDKGAEITLMDMSFGEDDDNKNMCMENTQVHQVLTKDEPKFLYLYDFLNMNIFYIDLVEISNSNPSSNPQILNTFGEYEVKKDKDSTIDLEEDTSVTSEIDDILNEYDEDNFESFDELDEDLY